MEFAHSYLASHPNLKAYYRLQDVNDSSGNGNTLTNTGSVTFEAAKFGNGASGFSGTKYLHISSDFSIGGGNATIYFWIKMVSDSLAYCIELSDIGTRTRFQVQIGGGSINYQRIREGVGVATASASVTTGTSVFHQVALTYDTSTIRGYYDGVLVATTTQSGNGSSGGSEEFVIGGVTGDSFVTAIMDDVAVLSTPLSAQDIAMLYQDSASSILLAVL